jgi:transcriptional regulator with AAA-type ATPase domain
MNSLSHRSRHFLSILLHFLQVDAAEGMTMALFHAAERELAEKVSELVVCNPFLPEWRDKERRLLGRDDPAAPPVYAWQPGWGLFAEAAHLGEQIDTLVDRARARLAAGIAATPRELALYEDVAMYRLYRHHGGGLDEYIDAAVQRLSRPDLSAMWADFAADFAALFDRPARRFPMGHAADHLFACFFQLRRAFYHIFHAIVGASTAASRLRGAVWQSVVTHDMRGWSRSLYRHMKDFPTLISGPSGTGKELVARAIGRSQYIPFAARRPAFEVDFTEVFHPLNLAALPAALIESELFGHKKGSFTGAVQDREGVLEACHACGVVFLDEVGELPAEAQVKLLRVLQSRTFQRVGDNAARTFQGKIVAATNRDLVREVQAGRLREDFYYRLCADRITTPSLREQLADRPEDLAVMVEYICRGVAGEEEAARLAAEVVAWVEGHLGRAYAWPGNFRELEQCVRSFAIRKEYHPLPAPALPGSPLDAFADEVRHGRLSAAELERRYCTLVFARAGGYQEAARRLGCDWRTLRGKVDRDFLRSLRE